MILQTANFSKILDPERPGTSEDKRIMMPTLFDGDHPEKEKQHYEWFNQYITFEVKNGSTVDATKEAIELFEHTLDKQALVWLQEHKAEFKDLTTLKNLFLSRYNPWAKQSGINYNLGTIYHLTPRKQMLMNKLI